MARIKMHISKAKLPFYPSCEIKYKLQNGVSTKCIEDMKWDEDEDSLYLLQLEKYHSEIRVDT